MTTSKEEFVKHLKFLQRPEKKLKEKQKKLTKKGKDSNNRVDLSYTTQ